MLWSAEWQTGTGFGPHQCSLPFSLSERISFQCLCSQKKRKNCKARPHFFLLFFFALIHTPGVYTDPADYSNYSYTYLRPFFLLQTSRKWVPKSIKHITGSFPPGTLHQVTKVRASLPNLGGAPFCSGSGCCRRLSRAGSSILRDDGADKRAALHISGHTKILISPPPAVEFAMNERFMSLNSRSLSMNDAFGLDHR